MLTEYLSYPVLCATLAVCAAWWLFGRFRHNLPPGPCGLPLLGYYPFLSRRVYVDFARLAEKYGEVVSFRSVGGALFVMLSGVKVVREVLVQRAEEFGGRPLPANLIEWISDKMGVTQEEGEPWREHRRFFLHSAKNFGFGKLSIESSILHGIEGLKQHLARSDGRPVHLRMPVARVTNAVIARILFDASLEEGQLLELAQGIHELLDVFADQRYFLVGWAWKYAAAYLFPWSSGLRRGRATLKKITKAFIEDHIRTFDQHHMRDYVDCYLLQMQKLKEQGKLEESTFTMGRLLSISMNMLMEGTESVCETVVSLLEEASRHPLQQEAVRRELDAVVGRGRSVSCADRSRLPYTEAFLQELLRTASPFNLSVFYSNYKETTIWDFHIPKRTIFVVNLWSLSNDPSLFPDPGEFDPGRFLGEDGKKAKLDGPHPFSLGKRDCVGQGLAQMEIFLILTSLIHSYVLAPGPQTATVTATLRE